MFRKLTPFHFEGEVILIKGNRPGPKLVITAGVDGDEYCGIEAANRIASQYSDRNFAGELVIIPILNTHAHKAQQSANPIDNLHPKYIFPGNPKKSSSYQLIYWLAQHHIKGAQAWLDLHSANKNEQLTPFLWTFKTLSKKLNTICLSMQQMSGCKYGVHENIQLWAKAWEIARLQCAYILAEAGELGEVNEQEVARHMQWAQNLMQIIGMLPGHPVSGNEMPMLYKKVTFQSTPYDGIWHSHIQHNKTIQKGEIIGTLTSDTKKTTLIAKVSGQPLWWKIDKQVKKGEKLMEIGY